jgi:hypothetical protein
MKQTSAFHKVIARDKGLFNGKNFLISTDSINWIHSFSLSITEYGQLYSSDESDNHYLLLQSLPSCYVQIYPSLPSSSPQPQRPSTIRKLSKKSSTNSIETGSLPEDPPVIFIKTFENDKLYIKVPSKSNFGNLISSLIVWQSLKPQGLLKKWYCENRVEHSNTTQENSDIHSPHELLVCRFKIYGPIPARSKNLNIVPGPKAPIYQPKINSGKLDFANIVETHNSSNYQMPGSPTLPDINNNIIEGWFYTMGVLKSNGILNFISELDGTLLYSIDVKSIMSSEIREIHQSIFDSSNVLFLGQLKELRFNNIIKTTSTLSSDQYMTPFLVRDSKSIPNNQRILIEFPLHIDLEDWFVGLNYFAKREYIGSYSPSLKLITSKEEETDEIKNPTQKLNPPISAFSRDNFRVSKKVSIDIIEAKFDNVPQAQGKSTGKIYAEVRMWGYPWSRTAIVNHTSNPFWKEEFSTDLPILTQMVHILIKRCSYNDVGYLTDDKLIGTVYVTPDILTKQVHSSSTMMVGSGSGNVIKVNGINTHNNNNSSASSAGGVNGTPTRISSVNNDIVRLSIYDSSNLPIGKLLLNVKLKEYHILNPNHFKTLENMLKNAPMKDLIKFCNDNVPSSDFEYVSLILLDIFQSLGVEDQWFKSLMEAELVDVDKMTRKNYLTNKRASEIGNSGSGAVPSSAAGNSSSSNNVFNTLFRGSSIFSKSLEKYNLRIGQEYLEKVFGDFFAKLSQEGKDCEVDPRYVKLMQKAQRKGKSLDDSDDSDTDSDVDSDVERERIDEIKAAVEANFQNLLAYADEIWNKIYITSNDLPEQIKVQLKNFRTKVELACDPEDKTTALNCLSAFIFLRFFCPAILNPKLFYLTKNHQTGTSQRTLTLIAKILLNLANRQEFSPHKEPHLVKMNVFLKSRQAQVFEYFDKITARKNDFNEKILDLSQDVKRFDLGLSADSTSSELPTTPYLIDKYLRLTEIIHLLDYSKFNRNEFVSPQHSSPMNDVLTSNSSIITSTSNNMAILNNHQRNNSHGSNNGVILLNDDRNVYQIGSLEFEKSEFLDLAGDNETEGFIKTLCRSNENMFSFIDANVTLKDLQKQSTELMTRITDLEVFLENCEFPTNYLNGARITTNPNTTINSNSSSNSINTYLLWEAYTNDILAKSYLDIARNCLVFIERDNVSSGYKKLVEHNALNSLKLKFSVDQHGDISTNGSSLSNNGSSSSIGGTPHEVSMSLSFSNSSLGSLIKTTSKNPFKKWLRK